MDVNLRFRATQDYATRNGFVGGVPTFYVANLPSNIVYGTLLIRPEAADWRDVLISELGHFDPNDFEARIRAVNAYAKRWGYASGFPTFFQGVAANDWVYGSLLFKPGTIQIQEPTASDLGNPPSDPDWFRAVQQFAAAQKFPGGYVTFEHHVMWQFLPVGRRRVDAFETVLLPPETAEFRDVPASKLDGPNLNDPAQHVRSLQKYAVNEGFVGAIPTFYFAEMGGVRCGTLLLDATGAEWQDVDVAKLENVSPDDQAGRFRAVQDYANPNHCVGGYPNFYIGERTEWSLHGGRSKVIVNGTVLVRDSIAEWRDVAAADIGNPADDDGPARFRGTQDFAVNKAGVVGGFPNFYEGAAGPGGPVYGTILLRSPVLFRDVFYQDLFTNDYIKGALREHWEALGGPAGLLGLPLTEELACSDGIGLFNRFDGGVIYFSPSTGPNEVHGAILDRWVALGSERSYLGYPVSDEAAWIDRVSGRLGRISRFERGCLVWIDDVIIEMPETVFKNPSIITPEGTALGGWVNLTLQSNGTYAFSVHMHDSGFLSYDFEVRASFNTPGGLALVGGPWKGSVAGTGSSGSRNYDHTEGGVEPLIATFWDDIKDGTIGVARDYSVLGPVGLLLDLYKAYLDLAAGVVGSSLGLIISLGSDIGALFPSLGIGETFGVIDGVVVFATGGGLALAVVQGVAVGAVTDAMVATREMDDGEKAFAKAVFGDNTLPFDRIRLTNLAGLGGRAFTIPGIDKKIYVNLATDEGYSKPTTYQRDHSSDTPGQLFIHELTHAWQIEHGTFLPSTVCKGILEQTNYEVGEDVYAYGPAGPSWGDAFGNEAQASIVEHWFAKGPGANPPNSGENDPYFMYIRDNIRKGVA